MTSAKIIREWMDALDEANDMIVAPLQGEVMGPIKENMGFMAAKAYLDQYPDGTLQHDILDNDSFVFVTVDGEYRFYNSQNDQVEGWDWQSDIENLIKYSSKDHYDVTTGWFYLPATEWHMVNGGANFLSNLRNGAS